MRHFRPEAGLPTPVDAVNATLLAAKLAAEPLATKARADLGDGKGLGQDAASVIVEDMTTILSEGREARGFGDINDLTRAGYHSDLAWRLGPVAAKELARRVAAAGQAEDEPEAA